MVESLGNGIPVAQAEYALLVGFDDALEHVRVFLFDPAQKGRSEIETDIFEIVGY